LASGLFYGRRVKLMDTRLFTFCISLLLLTLSAKGDDTAGYVQFNTSVGIINVRLLTEAPLNVANFLSYVNSGAYTSSIVHRSVQPDFIFQGGAYTCTNTGGLNVIPANAPVMGEHDPINNPNAYSNTLGTLALALSTGPDSGTNNWFFNLGDNSASLDGTADGGPFTVFGVVADANSLAVMENLGMIPVYDLTPKPTDLPFPSIPLIGYTPPNLLVSNLVFVYSITPLTPINSYFANLPSNLPAGSSDPSAIPFNDGVPNMVKYLCHINPNAPMSATARANLPTAGVKPGKIATFTYHQYALQFGVSATVQTSTDLQNWTTVSAAQTGTDANGDLIMQAQVTMTGGKQFFRLQVAPPPTGDFVPQ
jgi:cyclophilin family peptidyl-prolyl cis-trans isomerase